MEKGHCLVVVDSRPATTPVKMFHRYHYKGFGNLIFKSREHYEACASFYDEHYRGMAAKDIPVDETDIFDGVRFLNQVELERCQTVPEGYTSCLTRNEAADVLGDGWTIDVITHFFSFIPEGETEVFDKCELAAELHGPTDLSNAPEEIKAEIVKNDEILREREHTKEITEEETMETNNREPETNENGIAFDVVAQLRQLANERTALANLKPDNKRFADDVRAIEYAVSFMEAMGL